MFGEEVLVSAGKGALDFALSKLRERRSLRKELESRKGGIREARLVPVIWRQLHSFREFFLEHGLCDKHRENREFFDRWLSSAPVEMGWTPGNGWTQKGFAEMCADLEGVRP